MKGSNSEWLPTSPQQNLVQPNGQSPYSVSQPLPRQGTPMPLKNNGQQSQLPKPVNLNGSYRSLNASVSSSVVLGGSNQSTPRSNNGSATRIVSLLSDSRKNIPTLNVEQKDQGSSRAPLSQFGLSI